MFVQVLHVFRVCEESSTHELLVTYIKKFEDFSSQVTLN